MTLHRSLTTTSLVLALSFIAGCASSPKTSPVAAKSLKELPKIEVVLDCGACQVRTTVAPLIIQSYREKASKVGVSLNQNKVATVTIKAYSARNDAMRFMTGMMSGKDEIMAVVAYEGRSVVVQEYYQNAFQGIESVAEKIGELTFAELSQ